MPMVTRDSLCTTNMTRNSLTATSDKAQNQAQRPRTKTNCVCLFTRCPSERGGDPSYARSVPTRGGPQPDPAKKEERKEERRKEGKRVTVGLTSAQILRLLPRIYNLVGKMWMAIAAYTYKATWKSVGLSIVVMMCHPASSIPPPVFMTKAIIIT
jgi:hypothetical protein